jgi:hypothetical protein
VLVVERTVVSAESIDLLELWQQLRKQRDQAQVDCEKKLLAMKKYGASNDTVHLDFAVLAEERRSLKVARENLKDSEEQLRRFEKEHYEIVTAAQYQQKISKL